MPQRVMSLGEHNRHSREATYRARCTKAEPPVLRGARPAHSRIIIWRAVASLMAAASFTGAGGVQAETTKSIAHRGGSLFAPENTLAAFAAVSNECDLVEFDVHVSSDGHLVVMHDLTVDRTTDGTGPVSGLTLSQLKALDAGSWFSSHFAGETVPTLAEAVQAILPFSTPLIERKTGTAQAYVDMVRTLNASSNVVIQSFDWRFLADVNALDPSIRLAALGSGVLTSNTVTVLRTTGASIVAWRKDDISTTEVDLLHGLGMELYVWTANGPSVQTFVDLGVDGIISDDPALVRYLTDDRPSPNHDLAFGLVSYWKLDDGLADVAATDASDVEAANPGFLRGFDSPPSWTTGAQAKHGGALRLDGINDHVDIPPSVSLDINTNAVTISCWVNLSSRPSGIPESFGGVYDSEQDSYIIYEDRGARELRFKITTANSHAARPGIPEADITTGRWHHVAGVFDGNAGPVSGQAAVYLDGCLKDVHTGNDGAGNVGLTEAVKTGQHAALGRNGAGSRYWFSGSVDDIAIWRRALSHGELLQIFRGGANDAPLQKSVMTIRISDVAMEPPNLRFHVRASHASLMTDELVLQSSDVASGPYAHEGLSSALGFGNNEFLFYWPLGDGTSKFFRVVNP